MSIPAVELPIPTGIPTEETEAEIECNEKR